MKAALSRKHVDPRADDSLAMPAMIEIARAVNAKRSRGADLSILVNWLVDHMSSVEVTEERESYEVGACISIKEAARLIRIDKALYNPAGHRHHYSAEQLRYVEGLVRDLPAALRMAIDSAALQRRR